MSLYRRAARGPVSHSVRTPASTVLEQPQENKEYLCSSSRAQWGRRPWAAPGLCPGTPENPSPVPPTVLETAWPAPLLRGPDTTHAVSARQCSQDDVTMNLQNHRDPFFFFISQYLAQGRQPKFECLCYFLPNPTLEGKKHILS